MTYLLLLLAALAAQHAQMPAGMTHEAHLAQMKKDAELKARGALAMGFDQDKTAHHFLLTADGGIIEVGVSDPSDTANRDAIRSHLKEIAREFARGDFTRPFATHNEIPPGVKAMQQRSSSIAFRYEDTASGGRVVIRTADRRAGHSKTPEGTPVP